MDFTRLLIEMKSVNSAIYGFIRNLLVLWDLLGVDSHVIAEVDNRHIARQLFEDFAAVRLVESDVLHSLVWQIRLFLQCRCDVCNCAILGH